MAGDLSTLICKGSVDEEVLKEYAKMGKIDLPDKDGKTLLMLACWYGRKDTVQSLLEKGASPNSRSVKDGNTPMHYACMVEEPLAKWMAATKLAIIKLLISNGALAVQENQDGWSPVYVASLYHLTDVVEFLLTIDGISLEAKIKATEIMGVSQATLGERHGFKEAYRSFTQAISFQHDSSLPEPQTETSELAACFSKISLKECRTQEEIDLIRASEVAMKAHAFLVGERVFPNNLKQKYLYPSLLSFARDQEKFEVLSFALGLECEGELKLGSVAVNLAENSGFLLIKAENSELPLTRKETQTLQCRRRQVVDLLGAYEPILNHVPIDSLLHNIDALTDSFGEILFNEAFYCSNTEIFKSTLQAVEKSLRVIRGRIIRENSERYPEIPSVNFKIMKIMKEANFDKLHYRISSRAYPRVKFVIFNIFFCDNASYTDSSGNNILHLVASCTHEAVDFDFLMDLARFFVHFGCSKDVANNNGETAKGVLETGHEHELVHNRYNEFLRLVSPPTKVSTLVELSTKTVLLHHLSYLEQIPVTSYPKIEDEFEIELTSEDSYTESENSGMLPADVRDFLLPLPLDFLEPDT